MLRSANGSASPSPTHASSARGRAAAATAVVRSSPSVVRWIPSRFASRRARRDVAESRADVEQLDAAAPLGDEEGAEPRERAGRGRDGAHRGAGRRRS